jgi:hypothetical protein
MWDEQNTKLLLEMNSAGQGAMEISRLLGVSRSAVIGKLWRLKYKGKPHPKRIPKLPASPKPVIRTKFVADVVVRAPPAQRPRRRLPGRICFMLGMSGNLR